MPSQQNAEPPVSPTNPGLWVRAAVDPRRPFGPLVKPPAAMFACRCGFVRYGRGEAEVLDIVTNHHRHVDYCPLIPQEDTEPPARRGTRGAADATGSSQQKAERPGPGTPDLSGEPLKFAA